MDGLSVKMNFYIRPNSYRQLLIQMPEKTYFLIEDIVKSMVNNEEDFNSMLSSQIVHGLAHIIKECENNTKDDFGMCEVLDELLDKNSQED